MALAEPARTQRERAPIPIDRHAAANLRFIRDTMERASAFTAVPGWGGAIIGGTALVAGAVAWRLPLHRQFMVWLAEAAAAMSIAVVAVRSKSRRLSFSFQSSAARRALLSFMPPLMIGLVLTGVLYQMNSLTVIPGLWLLSYGAAVATGGSFSVRVVPVMGLCFMLLGTVCLMTPSIPGNLYLMLGFGCLHVAFGIVIARRYGG